MANGWLSKKLQGYARRCYERKFVIPELYEHIYADL